MVETPARKLYLSQKQYVPGEGAQNARTATEKKKNGKLSSETNMIPYIKK
jgi:hypothetical protein